MSQLVFSNNFGQLNADLSYHKSLNEIDLKKNDSLLLIGKSKDLKKVKFSDLSSALNALEISENWYDQSIGYLCSSPDKSDETNDEVKSTGSKQSTVNWLNKFLIHKLSGKISRNNTSSRSHLIHKFVKSHHMGQSQLIVIACPKKNAVASASAVARAFPLFSTKTGQRENKRNVRVVLAYTDSSNEIAWPNETDVTSFKCLADSIRLTAMIIDKPCADMTTDDFLDQIKLVGKELGIEPMVIEGEELKKRGFGGIYNVGKAAEKPPKLVVLSHLTSKAKRTVAWVGKGIVFDTGGLCIKSRAAMCGMKQDCGGAAGVLGAFYAAVKMGFEDNLHGIFCLAENAVGPNALRPDDIITLYSGKTVQITNTDAEGRLVLGDGVAYASKDLKADIIVDMATLTGAQGPATGKYHCAVVTNNEKWEKASVKAGKMCGDLCYPLIFAPEFHFSEFNTDFADMTNSVSNPKNAASSCAGLFIHSHLDSKFDGIWVHLDIASPVSDSNDRATGFGVCLLNTLFSDSITNSTMRKFETATRNLPLKCSKVSSDSEQSQAED